MRRLSFCIVVVLLLTPCLAAQTVPCSSRYTAILTNLALIRQQVVDERDKKGYVTAGARDAILAGLDLVAANQTAFKVAGCVVPDPAPVPAPTPTPTPVPSIGSPDGTRVPPAAQIIDAGRHVWTLNGSTVQQDGQPAAGGAGSSIAWCSGAVYVFGTDSAWYQWSGGWSRLGPTDPCAAPAPLPAPAPTPAPVPAPTPIPTTTPVPAGVLQPSDFTYLGSSMLPHITLPTGRFGFAHGAMTGRRVGTEVRLFVLGYVGASGTEELIECKWNGVGVANSMTFVKNWGDPTQGKMVTEGSAPRVQSLLWDATLNAVVWSYDGTYNVGGISIPSIGYSVLNDAAGTLTAYGPWRTATHSKKTEGYLLQLPASIQATLGGGKRFAVGAMQSSGNALSPWGAFLTAFAPPSTTTPADTVVAATSHAITDQVLIYSDMATPQIKDGNTFLCGWTNYGLQDASGAEPQKNPTQDGTGRTVNGALGGVIYNADTTPGRFNSTDAMMSAVWIDGPTKKGLVYFAQVLKTIPGFNYGGVDPTHAHQWYGPTQVYPTGKFCPHGHNGAWTGASTGDASDPMGNFLYIYNPADVAAVIAGTKTPVSITQSYAAVDAYPLASIAHGGSVQIDGVNHVDRAGASFPTFSVSAGTDAPSRGVWLDATDHKIYLIEILTDHVFSELQPVVHVFAVNY